MAFLQRVGQVLLWHGSRRMIVRIVVAHPVAQRLGALIVRIAEVGRDLADGAVAWQRELTEEGAEEPFHGYTTSPIVAGERVIVLTGGEGRSITAFDRATGEPAWAEEATQETFVRAWEKLQQFRAEGGFGGWLRRLAINVVLAERRASSRRQQRETASQETIPFPGGEPRPDLSSAMDLEQAIAALPTRARHVFVLHDIEGHGHEEIARMLEIAMGVTGADGGSLMLLDPKAQQLGIRVAIGVEPELWPKIKVALGEGIAGRAAAAGSQGFRRDVAGQGLGAA